MTQAFTPVADLSFPSKVIGLTDPCYIDTANEYRLPEDRAWGARVPVTESDWSAGIRYVYGDVAELRLVPKGAALSSVAVEWDGDYPTARSRTVTLTRVGDLDVDSGTAIAIDPTLVPTLDYQRHVVDSLGDGWVGPENSVLSSTGAGDGSYGIWAATDAEGRVLAVLVNFGCDPEEQHAYCDTCQREEDDCTCEQCPSCRDYYPREDLSASGLCEDCDAEQDGDTDD